MPGPESGTPGFRPASEPAPGPAPEPGDGPDATVAADPDVADGTSGPAPQAWDRMRHGAHGIPPCRECRTAMTRVGGNLGLQLWSDHWRCPACGWELRVSYGRGSV